MLVKQFNENFFHCAFECIFITSSKKLVPWKWRGKKMLFNVKLVYCKFYCKADGAMALDSQSDLYQTFKKM